ncbi:hypothetical protein [Pseudonocardia hierapolitana]|uniref:hypothetical protein n=1 Tax=Pseudonocardia hierapolitana TaxID=1128676 RepID=UPI001BAEF0E2|nr:hypothetical protein [Pseudonocardia hierapolitana]
MSSDTIARRSFLVGSTGALALGALGLSGCAAPTGGRSTLRFYQQKQEVITYFDGLLRRFESEHPGISVVHDTTDVIAPQFVRGEPADVGCFNDNLELARYISRGQMSDLSHLPSAATVRTDIGGLTDGRATGASSASARSPGEPRWSRPSASGPSRSSRSGRPASPSTARPWT